MISTDGIRGVAAALLGVLLGASVPAQIVGTATAIDGRTAVGKFTVGEDGRVTVGGDGGEVAWQLAELSEFRPAAAPASRSPSTPHRVWLRSGAELAATSLRLAAGTPARLVLTLPCGVPVELPLGMVRALRHAGAERPEPALFAADLREPPANDDLLFAVRDAKAQRSGVRITGVAGEQLAFDLRGRSYEFDFAGVAAIVFGNNTGFAPDRQPKPRTVVVLATGERLEGRLLALDERLRLRLDEGAVVDVAAAELVELSVASDRLVFLGALTPEVEQTPAFDRIWPWTIDRAIAGPGFVLGGKRHARGIGMVPRTRLTYTLDGKYDAFEAIVGIDDRAGSAGSAPCRILVDGETLFETVLAPGRPQNVSIELKRGNKLTLEVDFGRNYDLGDHCAFADARVIQR